MKNIKDVIIGIFAVIGFAAIVTGFTNEAEQEPTFGTPESHVWEMVCSESIQPQEHQSAFNTQTGAGNAKSIKLYKGYGGSDGRLGKCHLYNKVTGEVRMMSTSQKQAWYKTAWQAKNE